MKKIKLLPGGPLRSIKLKKWHPRYDLQSMGKRPADMKKDKPIIIREKTNEE